MNPASLPGAHATQAALTAARDTLEGVEDGQVATYLVLALLMLKIASDTEAAATDPDTAGPDPGAPISPGAQLLVVPPEARFEPLHQQRFLPGNDQRIMAALQQLARANPETLGEVFDVLRLHDGWPRDPDRRELALSRLLARLAIPALDFRSLRGVYRADIGEAVDRLLERSQPQPRSAPLAHVPDALAWLMAALMDPGEDDTICDLACHNGSLLLAAGQWARSRHGARRHLLYGQEQDDPCWARTRLRLLLHGEDNHGVRAGNPMLHDALLTADGGLRRFHVHLCRPPFALRWAPERVAHDPFHRYVHGVPPRQWGHLALLQHMLRALDRQHGRIAMVVPHGVLFRAGEEARIRQRLLEANLVESVIGLPDRLFAGMPVATALLVLRSVRNDEAVLFVDARRLAPAHRRGPKLDLAAAERLLAVCRQRTDVPGLASRVGPEALAREDGNLSVARYVSADDTAQRPAVTALRGERSALKAHLGRLEQGLDAELRALERQVAVPN